MLLLQVTEITIKYSNSTFTNVFLLRYKYITFVLVSVMYISQLVISSCVLQSKLALCTGVNITASDLFVLVLALLLECSFTVYIQSVFV